MDAISLGKEPIPGASPAGTDARYEPEYTEVMDEIGKLGSATQGGVVSWSRVAESGSLVLAQKSKDLQIATYVGIAWQKLKGLEGFSDAVELLLAFMESFWETGFPALAKMRRRLNAFAWWHERACSELENYDGGPVAETFLAGLADRLKALDERVGEVMPDATPLRDMTEALRRIPVCDSHTEQETAAEPAPKVQAAPEPAPVEKAPEPEKKAPPEVQRESPTETATPEDLPAALKAFSAAALQYAFLARKADPADPLAWQVLRLALWGKVTALPPATERETHIPAPDPDRLASLERLLGSGKFLEAALGAEDVFSASLFCLDAQYIIDRALEALGKDFARARESVRLETARFLERLPGIEELTFDGGTPFAGSETRAWLASLNRKAPVLAVSQASPAAEKDSPDLVTRAQELVHGQNLAAGLGLLEGAMGDSPAANFRLRVQELRLLCQEGEGSAAALAEGILETMEQHGLERWDTDLSVEALLVVRTALSLGGDRERARAVHGRIARLRPSAALDFKA